MVAEEPERDRDRDREQRHPLGGLDGRHAMQRVLMTLFLVVAMAALFVGVQANSRVAARAIAAKAEADKSAGALSPERQAAIKRENMADLLPPWAVFAFCLCAVFALAYLDLRTLRRHYQGEREKILLRMATDLAQAARARGTKNPDGENS